MTKKITKRTRWVIVNDEMNSMPCGVNELWRRTAIDRFVSDWTNMGVARTWKEWRDLWYRAVKATIEVLE